MLRFLFIFLALTFFCDGQVNFLALDIQRFKKVKRVSVYEKHLVVIKTKNGQKLRGVITSILDSSIVISGKTNVKLNDINVIAFDRSTFITRLLSRFFIEMGIGLPIISATNNAFNSNIPIFDPRISRISAAALVVGIIIYIIPKKRHHLGERKQLKILPLSAY